MKLGKGHRLVRSGIALTFLLTIYAGVLFHAIGGKMNDVVCAANFGLMPVRTEHWEFGDLDGVHIYFPHKVWKQVPYHWLGDWIETEKYISSPGDFLIEGGKWMEEGGAGIVTVILFLDLILWGKGKWDEKRREKIFAYTIKAEEAKLKSLFQGCVERGFGGIAEPPGGIKGVCVGGESGDTRESAESFEEPE